MCLLLAFLAGCPSGPPPPTTHKVEGSVVRKDGKPFTGGGHIEFINVANPQHRSFGTLDSEGAFTLRTIAGTQNIEGAQEGDHSVTIMLAEGDGKNPQRIELKKRYTIQAGEVNTIVVRLE
jgi:hypothetical protein